MDINHIKVLEGCNKLELISHLSTRWSTNSVCPFKSQNKYGVIMDHSPTVWDYPEEFIFTVRIISFINYCLSLCYLTLHNP